MDPVTRKMTNGDDPAFATFGTTKRELFAAILLGSIIKVPNTRLPLNAERMRLAVQYADQLIDALNEGGTVR